MNQLGKRWQYSIQWIPTVSAAQASVVMVTSKPRTQNTNQLVRVKVWTSQDYSALDTPWPSALPLAVYARVTVGDYPVQLATVDLQVVIERREGSILTMLPRQMRDGGNTGNHSTDT